MRPIRIPSSRARGFVMIAPHGTRWPNGPTSGPVVPTARPLESVGPSDAHPHPRDQLPTRTDRAAGAALIRRRRPGQGIPPRARHGGGRRGRHPVHLQPGRDLRERPVVPRRVPGAEADPDRDARASRRTSWPSRSTRTGSRTRPTTCSRWRPGWTRWCSARRRSTRRSARRSARPRPRAHRAPRRARCSTRRPGRAGARGPRRRSAPRPTRSSRSAPTSRPTSLGDLRGRDVVVVGAGQMAGLAVKHLRDRGVGAIRVVNRSLERARALAERSGAELRRSRSAAGGDRRRGPGGVGHRRRRGGDRRARGAERARREPARARSSCWTSPSRATSPRMSRRSTASG